MKKGSPRKDDTFARILRAGGNSDELDKIMQDECRRRACKKLAATLLSAPGFRFPTRLSAEQCTSDAVADFHASLVAPGSRVVDLTAGLGIDALHIARRASKVVCIEMNPPVAEAIAENSSRLGLDNVEAVCADCRDWIAGYAGQRFDVAFIDPARRGTDGSRLYSLTQCAPDVTAMLPAIERIAGRLIVKASPMLDITQTVKELPGIRAIYAVGTRNECKELLADIEFGYEGLPEIVAATDGQPFRMTQGATSEIAGTPQPGDTIGEPWPAVMKALSAATMTGLRLAASTFLYLNPDPATFPGEVYTIERIEPFSSSTLRRLAKEGIAASVATRNFPLSADDLRKRLKAKESAERRLMATTLSDGAQILAFLGSNVEKNA